MTNTFISPTELRSIISKDHLSFALSCKHKDNARKCSQFQKHLMIQGQKFEHSVIKYIRNTVNIPITTVHDRQFEEAVNRTKEHIHNRVPIIYQGALQDDELMIRGKPDLIVRGDCLEAFGLSNKEDDRYVIIDIKCATILLSSDGTHMTNSKESAYYKAQCGLYALMLGNIVGYQIKHAYILPKNYRFTSNGVKRKGIRLLERLGCIDFDGRDSGWVQTALDSLAWAKYARERCNEWDLDTPTIPELFPRLSVDSGCWNEHKQLIARRTNDITLVWGVQDYHRTKLLEYGIDNWPAHPGVFDRLGIKGKRSNIIRSIIDINMDASTLGNIHPPNLTKNVLLNHLSGKRCYVDFETLSDIFSEYDHLPVLEDTSMIFMIGVAYEDDEGNVHYIHFTCTKRTHDDEKRIMNDFIGFLLKFEFDEIVYWSADKKFWDIASKRHKVILDGVSWFDLSDAFTDSNEPIVVKGCFNFKLKPLAKTMKAHGMISTFNESDCTNGMDAMIDAWTYYEDPEPNQKLMDDIITYNAFDCKVLWDIMRFLECKYV